MTTSPTVPMAQKRQKKTRTKHVSSLPVLAVSKLLPNHIDLLPGTESLVCPNCETWCPITGHQGRTPKLVPHHTNRAGTPQARRCIGSNRRVLLDLTIPEWRHRLGDAIADTASRRATTVLRKPKTPPAPAASQITPVPLSAEAARKAYRGHLQRCTTCEGRTRCTDGQRLAEIYARLERQEPRRKQVRDAFARERARFDRRYAALAAEGRAAEWTKQTSRLIKKDRLAKWSGTNVEERNNQCKLRAKGSISEFRGPDLPLMKPVHIA